MTDTPYQTALDRIRQAADSGAESLDLPSLGLTSLPYEIGKLTSLIELNLWNNQLTSLSPEIGQLARLTELCLSRNQLTRLPPEIGQLTSLTQLDLSKNQFTSLPPEIGQRVKHAAINRLLNTWKPCGLTTSRLQPTSTN